MAEGGRRLARTCAVQALYQWAITGQNPGDIEERFIRNQKLSGKYLDYFRTLIVEAPRNVQALDAMISPHLDRKLDSLDLIEHAVLRVAVYELMFEKDIPRKVVMDEAIEIAKTFGSEQGYKYVNGVLDKVAKQLDEN